MAETVIRFDKVQFEFGLKTILEEASFSVREGQKMTIMGQNGAGKTTMFKLMMGEFQPKYGKISIDRDLRIAISRQIMLPEDKEMNVQAFFRKYFADDTVYNIDARIAEVLEIVNLRAPLDKIIGTFS